MLEAYMSTQKVVIEDWDWYGDGDGDGDGDGGIRIPDEVLQQLGVLARINF
jgi:hypothetical protein